MVATPMRGQLMVHPQGLLQWDEPEAPLGLEDDVVMRQAGSPSDRTWQRLMVLHENAHLLLFDCTATLVTTVFVDRALGCIQEGPLDACAVEV